MLALWRRNGFHVADMLVQQRGDLCSAQVVNPDNHAVVTVPCAQASNAGNVVDTSLSLGSRFEYFTKRFQRRRMIDRRMFFIGHFFVVPLQTCRWILG